METLLNDGWEFVKTPLDATPEAARAAAWRKIGLPHDWLIGQHENLYEDSAGWYRRTLRAPEPGRSLTLSFDGVYMDCRVLVNGRVAAAHAYGYTAFRVPLTPFLMPGENEIMVHARHQAPNSRWYSGAGIFRDVTLLDLPARHLTPDGDYITARYDPVSGAGRLTLRCRAENTPDGETLLVRLLDQQFTVLAQSAVPVANGEAGWEYTAAHVSPWSPDAPSLYALEMSLAGETTRRRIGFRTVETTAEGGLLLNGRHIKLHGVCLHHDLGALGAAFHADAARRQLRLMREMGVNALRTAHNPPARQVMDLCDEMGLLVVSEAFDMWRKAKTPYDYARFFAACEAEDVESWVLRDRNRPSLLMWSIGNEILDTHADAEAGYETARLLRDQVRALDPAGNGLITFGSNYMPWENTQRCAGLLQAVGYNYGEKYYAAHHAAHPEWRIYGSETASLASSRGVYHFPIDAAILSDEDLQCSALGNSATSWGARNLPALTDDERTPFSLGQFLWSGIDYIGEPTPYHTRSSYLGQADTACFPKDAYYFFQALWTRAPMVHIGVYWDWNAGQLIDVPVMTNGDEAELFLNGVSLGRKAVSFGARESCLPVWRVPYAPGELTAVAYRQGRPVARDAQRSFSESARIVLTASGDALPADGRSLAFITVGMADESGAPVRNACDRVAVSVTGAGRLLGLDNGDSTDEEGYQTHTRRLFNGSLLAIIGAADTPGIIAVSVSSPGKAAQKITLRALPVPRLPGVGCREGVAPGDCPPDRPVRRIRLTALGERRLSPACPSVAFRALCLPENADGQKIEYRLVTAGGLDSPCGRLEETADGVIVHAVGDGAAYLRATCKNGAAHARIISQLEIDVTGFGAPYLDPYGFVPGGLHSLSSGDLGPGNEGGVAFARDGESMAGFERVDFGVAGSDEITLPIFALTGEEYCIALWLGVPDAGGRLLTRLRYRKPTIWNTYQPETYRLPERLTGVQTLCFVLDRKLHLRGFSFTRQSRAWRSVAAGEADALYGDSFTRAGDAVTNVGNNVTLLFRDMDFERATCARLHIDGETPLSSQPITLCQQAADGAESRRMLRFDGGARHEQTFCVDILPNVRQVSFLFLPGSRFNFYAFRFERVENES